MGKKWGAAYGRNGWVGETNKYLGRVEHRLRLGRVHGHLLDLRKHLGIERVSPSYHEHEPRKLVVVGDHLDELGEVVRVPLAHAHGERVDVLVERVEDGDRLDDVLVGAVHVKLDLASAIRMRQSELRLDPVVALELAEEGAQVESAPADELGGQVVAHACDPRIFLDHRAELVVGDAERVLRLLLFFGGGHVLIEAVAEGGTHHALGHVVDILKRLLSRLEGHETAEGDHLERQD